MRNQTQPEASLDPDIATLVHKLRERLTAGKALPAERAIADEYAVKRHRVRQALACLREQGDLDSTRRISATGGELLIRSTNPLEVIELRDGFNTYSKPQFAVAGSPSWTAGETCASCESMAGDLQSDCLRRS